MVSPMGTEPVPAHPAMPRDVDGRNESGHGGGGDDGGNRAKAGAAGVREDATRFFEALSDPPPPNDRLCAALEEHARRVDSR